MTVGSGESPAIVFVHLGESIPRHLLLNLQGTINRFPEHDVYLVRDYKDQASELDKRVKVVYLPAPVSLPSLTHDERFWDNWWAKTLHRLLVLEEAHRKISASSILHIESDVFLSKSFPFDKLQHERKLAWPNHIGKSDIASILFSPSLRHTKKLSKGLSSLVRSDPSLTDMTALYLFRVRNPEAVSSLNQDPILHSLVFDYGGVFDGAYFGSHIFGSDPSAKAGVAVRRKLWSGRPDFLAGAKFTVRGGFSTMQMNNGSSIALHNLHVHSKDLKFFRSQLSGKTASDITPKLRYSFSWRGLLKWLIWKSSILFGSIRRIDKWRELPELLRRKFRG